jgi:betaine-aldehyde dehydrogenase
MGKDMRTPSKIDAAIDCLEALPGWTATDSEGARALLADFVDTRLSGRGPAEAAAAAERSFRSLNPATGEVLGEFEIADAAAIDAAVERALKGQAVWSAMTGAERGRVLRRAADILRRRNDELAELETRDTGKPIQETSVVDVLSGAECLEYFAGLGASLAGEHIDLGPAAFGYTRREPLGVTAGIGAWNYPLQIACWKSAPA